MNSNPLPTLWADGMDHFNSIPVSCIRHCHAQGRTGWRLLCGLLSCQPSCAHNKSRCHEGQLITNNRLPSARFVQVQKSATIVLMSDTICPLRKVWAYSIAFSCIVSMAGVAMQQTLFHMSSGAKNLLITIGM